jgi:hypothetical protein
LGIENQTRTSFTQIAFLLEEHSIQSVQQSKSSRHEDSNEPLFNSTAPTLHEVRIATHHLYFSITFVYNRILIVLFVIAFLLEEHSIQSVQQSKSSRHEDSNEPLFNSTAPTLHEVRIATHHLYFSITFVQNLIIMIVFCFNRTCQNNLG